MQGAPNPRSPFGAAPNPPPLFGSPFNFSAPPPPPPRSTDPLRTSTSSFTTTKLLSSSFLIKAKIPGLFEQLVSSVASPMPPAIDRSGTWECYSVVRDNDDRLGRSLVFGLKWAGCKIVACSAEMTMARPPGTAGAGTVRRVITQGGMFPFAISGSVEISLPLSTGEIFSSLGQEFEVDIQVDNVVPLAVPDHATLDVNFPLSEDLARIASSSLTSAHPNDVQFNFPDRRSLWANSTILKARSPYFEQLLSSSFSESSKSLNSTSTQNPSQDEVQIDFDDSDAEVEPSSSSVKLIPPKNEDSDCRVQFHQVPVSSGSYETYHSLLCWLYTGHIDFAHLKSNFIYQSFPPKNLQSRHLYLREFTEKHPGLPLAVSTKSIYRLAHFLELPELEELALKQFEKQLDNNNVAFELWGETAEKYEKIRDVCLDVAVKNWSEVVKSYSMIHIEAECERGVKLLDSRTSLKLAKLLGQRGRMPAATSPFS